jgi:hypothetical protein
MDKYTFMYTRGIQCVHDQTQIHKYTPIKGVLGGIIILSMMATNGNSLLDPQEKTTISVSSAFRQCELNLHVLVLMFSNHLVHDVK